jgi:hypothetical protein
MRRARDRGAHGTACHLSLGAVTPPSECVGHVKGHHGRCQVAHLRGAPPGTPAMTCPRESRTVMREDPVASVACTSPGTGRPRDREGRTRPRKMLRRDAARRRDSPSARVAARCAAPTVPGRAGGNVPDRQLPPRTGLSLAGDTHAIQCHADLRRRWAPPPAGPADGSGRGQGGQEE